ncbi:MAG: hypothetical protein D6687_00950 [Acidobacteria bacterium]|jgi:hypothetical protein|nr:MAG: hypothetical protein D6687_00950 [Acidobacteriota bacterium]GIU83146.1 MAG: hypothetical protein KatS3mg006_2210 [Pyrinomonadaceae bacterium]
MQEEKTFPPKLKLNENGDIEIESLADVIQWFLLYDQKTAIMRHPQVEELFQWKQEDDAEQGLQPYLFDSAEARFAIGVFQALAENNTQEKLHDWIVYLLQILSDAKMVRETFVENYELKTNQGVSFLKEALKLPSEDEKRLFLTSAWLEALCTAEARILGWVYQELYKRPFQIHALAE